MAKEEKDKAVKPVIIETTRMKLADLNGATYNPRKIKPQQLKALKKSIEKFGILDPLIVNRQTGNTIVGGHQRYRIAQELKHEDVPVNVIDVSPEDEKVLNVALNNIGGEFDKPKLEALLKEVVTFENLDLELTGFRPEDISAMISEKTEDEIEAEYPITPYFSEKYNYVVIMTKNEVDWTFLRNALGIETVKSYKSSAVGTGKVVDFAEFEKRWNNRNS